MTMFLEIKLKDPTLCTGCPLTTDTEYCGAMFKREYARLVKCDVDHSKEMSGLPSFLQAHQPKTDCGRKHWSPLRPQACILVHEKDRPIGGTLVQVEKPEEKNDKPES